MLNWRNFPCSFVWILLLLKGLGFETDSLILLGDIYPQNIRCEDEFLFLSLNQ